MAARHGWYVNLQRPYPRTAIGIGAMDLAEPDRSWRWKDKDEFEELADRSVFDDATTSRVREEAEMVIGRIENADEPFCEPWPSWRPDPRWPIPSLTPTWDVAVPTE